MVHELHHGLGWDVIHLTREGGENGEPEKLVRPVHPILCYEKFVCFRTTSGILCPIEPYLVQDATGMSADEITRRQEKLASILQSNNLFFCAGNTVTKLYA